MEELWLHIRARDGGGALLAGALKHRSQHSKAGFAITAPLMVPESPAIRKFRGTVVSRAIHVSRVEVLQSSNSYVPQCESNLKDKEIACDRSRKAGPQIKRPSFCRAHLRNHQSRERGDSSLKTSG